MSALTQDALTELGRRAVACRAWRWMPGMQAIYTGTWCHEINTFARVLDDKWADDGRGRRSYADDIPDLTDPATLGCVLALVREARSEKSLFVESFFGPNGSGPFWTIDANAVDYEPVPQSNEAAALVDALECAS